MIATVSKFANGKLGIAALSAVIAATALFLLVSWGGSYSPVPASELTGMRPVTVPIHALGYELSRAKLWYLILAYIVTWGALFVAALTIRKALRSRPRHDVTAD
jgi:hypothetical protein